MTVRSTLSYIFTTYLVRARAAYISLLCCAPMALLCCCTDALTRSGTDHGRETSRESIALDNTGISAVAPPARVRCGTGWVALLCEKCNRHWYNAFVP